MHFNKIKIKFVINNSCRPNVKGIFVFVFNRFDSFVGVKGPAFIVLPIAVYH